jgi:hypothetical protein
LVRIIEKHIDFVQIIIEDTNYKDQLLRKFQSLYHVPPRYKEIAVVGPPHDRIFTMGVIDPNDKILTTATARNKKVAEQEASRMALELLEPSLNEAFNTTAQQPPSLVPLLPQIKPEVKPVQNIIVQPPPEKYVKQESLQENKKIVRSKPKPKIDKESLEA